MQQRRTFTAQQRLEIVLEGLRDGSSVSEVCRRYQLSPAVFYRWRDQLFAHAPAAAHSGEADQIHQRRRETLAAARLHRRAVNLERRQLPLPIPSASLSQSQTLTFGLSHCV